MYYIRKADIGDFYELQIERLTETLELFPFNGSTRKFECAIRNEATGEFKLQIKSADELIKSLPVIHDAVRRFYTTVHFRPWFCSIILVDDVSLHNARKMYRDGFEPCLIVETSPQNYQVWVCLTRDFITKEQATAASKYLAVTYEGDKGACHYRHLGKLPGFPNVKMKRKPSPYAVHERDGRFPLIRVEYGDRDRIASEGHTLLAKLPAYSSSSGGGTEELADLWEKLESAGCFPHHPTSQVERDCTTFYKCKEGDYRARGQAPEAYRSEIDFAVACKLIKKGYSYDAVMDAIARHSPCIEQRKLRHVDDYVRRTVAGAAHRVLGERAPYTTSPEGR